MKKNLKIVLTFVCLLFVFASCDRGIDDPAVTTGGFSGEIEAATRESVSPEEAEALADFIERMYQTAIPAEKSFDDLEETLSPGELPPPACLPSVADGVVGSTVVLSLRYSEKDVFVRTHPSTDGMTLAIVAANGEIGNNFQPLLVVLDTTVPYIDQLVEDGALVQGRIRAVCFLDGNEYFYVASCMYALSEISSDGETAEKDVYATFGADGAFHVARRDGSEIIQTADRVFERMYGRYGVMTP